MAEPAVRLPLQIGTTALRALVVGGLLFVPGAAFTVVAIEVFLLLSDALGEIGAKVSMVVVVPAIALLWGAVVNLQRAWKARPSDIVVGPDDIAISGGPMSRRRFAWESLGEPAVEKHDDVHQLVLASGTGKVVLAIAEEEGEIASLEEVARTIHGTRAARLESAAAAPGGQGGPEVLACPACGAPAAPVEVEKTRCAFCGAEVPVPPPLRDQVRAALDVARRPARQVAALLDQPGARLTGGIYAAGAVLVLSAWPVAIAVLLHNLAQEAFTWGSSALLLLFVLALSAGAYALVRTRLVDRLALRLVVLDFAARAPPAAGAAPLCRQCGAPLAARAAQVVVRCVYCQADNVLGVDLHREAAAAREERQSLESAIARRAAERRRLRGAGILAVALLVLSGWSLRHGVGHNPRTWPLEQRCDAGDLDGCIELGKLLADWHAEGVRHDGGAAARAFRRACDGKRLEGCNRLAALHLNMVESFSGHDAVTGVALRRAACDGGYLEACFDLAENYQVGDFLGHLAEDPAAAARLYQRACDGGHASACSELGLLHKKGTLGAPDDPRAVDLFRRACDAADAAGCNNLGTMYYAGRGVAVDRGKAIELYRRACDGGDRVACGNLSAASGQAAGR